jgi:hypothetical protein
MNILHVGDLHVKDRADDAQDELFEKIRGRVDEVDLVFFAGDITSFGQAAEYRRFFRYIESFKDKAVLIRGNHDAGFFMDESGELLKYCQADINFDPHEFPIHEWKADWWESINAQTKRFDRQRRLPHPYNLSAQAEIIKLIDGTGPYYSFERDGWRFIILDTCRWILGERQYSFIERELQSADLPTIIFLHHTILPTGSIFDGAVLWDKDRLFNILSRYSCIKGVFSGHVHYNRIWDLNGKKIVSTADRGGMRQVCLGNTEIAFIESLGNQNRYGSGAVPPCDLSDRGCLPFQLKYLFASQTLSLNSFRCTDKNIWTSHPEALYDECIGWVDQENSGGLRWTIPAWIPQNSVNWFGINFFSSSKWKVTVTKNNQTVFEEKGEGGEYKIVSSKLELNGDNEYTVCLENRAPAKGHASPYIVFDNCPVSSFNRYL